MKKRDISVTVNNVPVEATIDDGEYLIDFLRGELGLTGTKRSCDAQICGVCTVLLDKCAVSACKTLAYEGDQASVETIEGANNGQIGKMLQRKFIEHGALQCGFCTPGMIMSAKALLEKQSRPSRQEIVDWLDGNLCRCTGYFTIVNAILAASHEL